MTSTPLSISDEYLNETWIQIDHLDENSLPRNTPPVVASNIYQTYMEKLLLEAQRESSHSSFVDSEVPSRRDSPRSSHTPRSSYTPRSSHSPVPELVGSDLTLLRKGQKDKQVVTDWIWDWSSRPEQQPPKQWKFKHPQRSSLSFRHSKVVKQGLFSKETLSIFLLTNLLSLIIGAGLGLYFGKRVSSQPPSTHFLYMPLI